MIVSFKKIETILFKFTMVPKYQIGEPGQGYSQLLRKVKEARSYVKIIKSVNF